MSQEYFFRSGGRVFGPYSIARLHSMARNGDFSSICEVSTDKQLWYPAADIPGVLPKVERSGFSRPPKPAPSPQHRDAPAEFQDNDAEVFGISRPDTLPQPKAAVPPDETRRWFYTRQGREASDSVDWESLQRMVSTAGISLTDHVWTEGYQQWTPVVQVPGLTQLSSRRDGADGMAVAAAFVGATALLLFTSFMIPIALKLRSGQFAPASNPLLIIGSASALLLGVLSIVLGHLRLAAAQTAPPHSSARSAVIVGLIGGYTVVIMEAILTVVIVVYAVQNS